MELFKAVLKWTDSECARQGINIEEDKTARRRILGDSVYEIRFLEMSQENIIKYVSPTEILKETEIICILQKINGLDVAGLKWKEDEKRLSRPFVTFRRFAKVVAYHNKYWNYFGSSDALTLTVNKAVLFHGVRLFGHSGGSQYEVNFKIEDENITGTYTSELDDDGLPGYDVILPNPISLPEDEEITVIATIKGPKSYYGLEGKLAVTIDDIVVNFKDAPSSLTKNSTNKTRGQFYQIFLSKL